MSQEYAEDQAVPRKSRFFPPEVRLLLLAVMIGSIVSVVLALAAALLLVITGRARAGSPWMTDMEDNFILSFTVQYAISFLPYIVLAAAVCVATLAAIRRVNKSSNHLQRQLAEGLASIAAALKAQPVATPAPRPIQETHDASLVKELNLELERLTKT